MIRNLTILLLLSLSLGTVTDIDGNIYETVQIGSQLWMAENLKVTHYNNDDEIPNLTINNDWTSASIGAYSDYDNNSANSETYGRLYNWYTVNDDRGICPEDYHVPTDDEYNELEVYLGMSESETNTIGFRGTNEGSKLAGNSELWNIGVLVIDADFGTSEFNAFPAGFRIYSSGDFDTVGKHCYFWSSSENDNSHAWYRNLTYFNTRVHRNCPSKQSGFSIRCVADEITTGCTDPEACNYDESVNSYDGSCEYFDPEIMCDCDETFLDINGDCCGYLVMDECMVCNGDGSSCDGTLLVPSEYATIQEAINAALDGDSILVSAGTYYENITWSETNGVKLIGSGENDCFIDGGSLASVIRFEDQGIIDSTTLITGFTIQNGYAQGDNPNNRGGGMYLYYSDPTLTDVTFSGNMAFGKGGGIYLSASSINGSYILINNNYSEGHGAGIFIGATSNINLNKSTIASNMVGEGDTFGAGIYADGGTATLVNSIVYYNRREGDYGGNYNLNGYTMDILNEYMVSYSNIEGDENWIPEGVGNISIAPEVNDFENGDFTLQPSSPCIDAGDPKSEPDPDGTRADMGAFYFDQSSSCDGLYTDIDGYCYYQADLDVLQILIDNSAETIYMDMDDNENGIIEPLELGQQEWDEGRISQLICSWTDGGWKMCEVSGPIPDEIGDLVKLTELDFYGNNLSGEIPSEIGNLVLLEYLKLTSNQLIGEIPQEIWTLTNLISLQLGSNQLTGEISPEIGNLINLEMLTLGAGNQFSGTILDKIENLVNLKWLTIEYAGFTGEIPDYIGDFTNLVGLILHHNQLTGEVPDNLWNLTNISRIELGDNQLTGEIPSQIGNFENLQTLYLYNTGFSGLIPESLCDLDLNWNFYWNNISSCKFCPPYPECIEEYIGEQDISGCTIDTEYLVYLHEGSNLMSFSLLPEDNSVESVLSSDNISAIAGEGEAAMNTGTGWVGSLTNILYKNGYWLLANDEVTLPLSGIPIDPDQQYTLHSGSNLISYPLSDCGSIDEVLPDDVKECIYAIAGEGVAALSTYGGWVGSLSELCPDEGFWFVNICDEITFIFEEPSGLARKEALSPSPYPYNQSSRQAFYFIEFIENIEIGDWILAYSGDKVIGTRQWKGSIIDVPAMGSDGSVYTEGYMETGIAPEFKVKRGDVLIDLEGYVPEWSENGFFTVLSLIEANTLPETFSLQSAYPNPFNPITLINFELPNKTKVILEVYDINGRIKSNIVDNIMTAGYHSIIWNAENHSSGVYFIRMQAGDFMSSQKLMLVK